ncbi:MAG: hypothetical protein M3142_05895 [Bacteroidota bacterium]|nr:hypothetical protein [Bacteroidota bacterium]
MDLFTFCRLSLSNRQNLVREQGRFLQLRQHQDYYMCLYDMRKFFVEVWYNSKTQQVFRVLAFTSTNYLEPYLENINLIQLSNYE